MIKKILPICLLAFALHISAQEKEANIEEVILYDKFLNLSYENANENVIVIKKKDLENAPAQSIDEVLQQYVGMDVKRRGANGVQSDISIRGGSFEQVLILLNGIRMNDSQTGHNSFNIPVDMSNVERIEIVKGPAARRFGQNAYSGVINIVTKTSSEEKVKSSVEYGDFKTYTIGASGTFGSDKFTNLVQVTSSQSDGYRYNTDYQIDNYFYQNQYQLKNGKILFQGGYSEKKFGANGFYSSPTAIHQYEETQASVVSLALQQNFGKFNFNSSISWRRGQDLYLFNREKPEIYRNMHIGNNLGAEVNGSYQSSIGTTGMGAEYRKEYLASNNLGSRERDVTTIFLEHHFSLLENKLTVSPGISWANYDGDKNFFYPGLDVGYALNMHHKFYGNIAKVHRIPTFTDLFYVSGTEQGNPNLQPESALSYEVGYRFLKNNWSAAASVFGRNSEDTIDFIKNTQGEKWTANNVGNVTTQGLEVEVKKTMNSFIKSYSVGYVFLENKVKQEAPFSRYISDNFKHQLIGKLENKLGKYFTNQVIYRYQQRIDGQSYHLVDEKLNFNYKDVQLFVLINNLTNTKYTEAFGVPMPNRWFHVGVSYDIPLN